VLLDGHTAKHRKTEAPPLLLPSAAVAAHRRRLTAE